VILFISLHFIKLFLNPKQNRKANGEFRVLYNFMAKTLTKIFIYVPFHTSNAII
jgi:hypothetical protein